MTTPSSPLSPFIADQIHAMLLAYSKKIPAIPGMVITLNLPDAVTTRLQQFYARAKIESLTCKDLPDSRFTLADESVDLIIANFMQSDPVNPAVLFADAKRILTRNGVFIFATFDSSSRAELKKVMANAVQADMLDEKKAVSELSHISFFRFSTIKERIVVNAETRGAIYCDIFVVSNPKIHTPLKSVMDALFMEREESSNIEMAKNEGAEQEDAHEREATEGEEENEEESETEHEKEHENEHEEEHEEEHETAHEQEQVEERERETESEQEHAEEHETEHEQEHEEEHESEHEREQVEEHETEHEQEQVEEHETEHEQEMAEEHETEHEGEHEEAHETEHDEEREEEDETEREGEHDTEQEQESAEEHETEHTEEREEHEKEQREIHHQEHEKIETPEHEKLADLAHDMDKHREVLQSHASKLSQHMDNSARLFKQLAEPGLSAEVRKTKTVELQTREAQHKEMLNTYKTLHDEHGKLLSDFLDSHEKALASNPQTAEKYHALIAKHLQLFSQHDEQIKQYEAFVNRHEDEK